MIIIDITYIRDLSKKFTWEDVRKHRKVKKWSGILFFQNSDGSNITLEQLTSIELAVMFVRIHNRPEYYSNSHLSRKEWLAYIIREIDFRNSHTQIKEYYEQETEETKGKKAIF